MKISWLFRWFRRSLKYEILKNVKEEIEELIDDVNRLQNAVLEGFASEKESFKRIHSRIDLIEKDLNSLSCKLRRGKE